MRTVENLRANLTKVWLSPDDTEISTISVSGWPEFTLAQYTFLGDGKEIGNACLVTGGPQLDFLCEEIFRQVREWQVA